MTGTRWNLLTGAIACEVTATLSLRAATDDARWYVLVVLGYCASFVFLGRTLRVMPIGVAYAIWGAAGILLTTVIAALVFGEALTPLMAAGMLLVIVGVVLVELGSHPSDDVTADKETVR